LICISCWNEWNIIVVTIFRSIWNKNVFRSVLKQASDSIQTDAALEFFCIIIIFFFSEKNKFIYLFIINLKIVSRKLINLKIWSKQQKFRTFLLCNLFIFQTDWLCVAGASFVQVEVKKIEIFIILTIKRTCYVGFNYIQKQYARSFSWRGFSILYVILVCVLICGNVSTRKLFDF